MTEYRDKFGNPLVTTRFIYPKNAEAFFENGGEAIPSYATYGVGEDSNLKGLDFGGSRAIGFLTNTQEALNPKSNFI